MNMIDREDKAKQYGRLMAIKAALLVFAFMSLAAGYDVVYVQSARARVLEGPAFDSKISFIARKGQVLKVTEKKSQWVKVADGDREGWVLSILVGPGAPISRISYSSGNDRSSATKKRGRVSNFATVAAIRGLAEDDRRRLGHSGRANYPALEEVESLDIPDGELDLFLNQSR